MFGAVLGAASGLGGAAGGQGGSIASSAKATGGNVTVGGLTVPPRDNGLNIDLLPLGVVALTALGALAILRRK